MHFMKLEVGGCVTGSQVDLRVLPCEDEVTGRGCCKAALKQTDWLLSGRPGISKVSQMFNLTGKTILCPSADGVPFRKLPHTLPQFPQGWDGTLGLEHSRGKLSHQATCLVSIFEAESCYVVQCDLKLTKLPVSSSHVLGS